MQTIEKAHAVFPVLTHEWIPERGWRSTLFCHKDFTEIEVFGESEIDGTIFFAVSPRGGKHIFKGYYSSTKYRTA